LFCKAIVVSSIYSIIINGFDMNYYV